MKKLHPNPSLIISLLALFVALGGTSYAAISSVPANSVGTAQLKNGAVTSAKLNAAVLLRFVQDGGTLPSGATEVGDWGFGTRSDGGLTAGSNAQPVASYAVPLAKAPDHNHTIYVSGSSAPHCPGAGHADRGYLCLYQGTLVNAYPPDNSEVFNPEVNKNGPGRFGFGIYLAALDTTDLWQVTGTYAVTAP